MEENVQQVAKAWFYNSLFNFLIILTFYLSYGLPDNMGDRKFYILLSLVIITAGPMGTMLMFFIILGNAFFNVVDFLARIL